MNFSTFPWTKTAGVIGAVSGALAGYAFVNKLNTLALWSGGVFAASTALGNFMSRNHSTTDEQAVGISVVDANRTAALNAPEIKPVYNPAEKPSDDFALVEADMKTGLTLAEAMKKNGL
jgi:hypothetical protein